MMTEEQAKLYLPQPRKQQGIDPTRLKYLIMASPKWGKTTFFTGIEDTLLLAFEEGYGFVNCSVICINAWDQKMLDRGAGEDDETGIVYTSAMEAIEALEAYNPYKFIIIDTVDQAVKMCADYECKRAGLAHPSDGGDYGKGWDLYQTNPFRRFYNRLVKLGVGVACITHVKEDWKKNKFGVEEFRRETSLPAGIQRFIHQQSDVIINGMLGRRRKGQEDRDRVISFDGTNEIMAGTRIRKIRIPRKYIVSPPTYEDDSVPWKQWTSFFTQSPTAGLAAEDFYNRTIRGKEDENEVEEEEKKETQNEKTNQEVNRVSQK
jgi:AAA domain